jgi:hypothetical protein
MSKHLVPSLLVALAALAIGCVTPMTQEDVRQRIEDVAGRLGDGKGQRVYPIYAETKLVAWAKLTEAKREPSIGPSAQLAKRLKRAASRKQRVVVGGPYPELTDRVLANALSANRDGSLEGLTIIFVSSTQPSPGLSQEAQNTHIRIVHRDF